MFAFQPTTTEASGNATPSATPRKRTKPLQITNRPKSPKTIQSPITGVKTKQSANFGAGNQMEARKRKRKTTTRGYQAMPELDANANRTKRKKKGKNK